MHTSWGGDKMSMEQQWNGNDRGKPNNPEKKKSSSATLPTTNPTWIDMGVNLGLHGQRPATNRLSHGMDCKDNT
jgi:hypothetical protein